MQEDQSQQQEYQIYDPQNREIRVVVVKPSRPRYGLHLVLFFLTVLSTLGIGARLQFDFINNLPTFDKTVDLFPWRWILEDPRRLLMGIPFSACVLGILTAHEMGHYVLCVRRRVPATLPFFIPFPNFIGTLGAFIRIKAPFRNRKDLFDIGIAGPIAGFVVAVPVLFVSLLLSKQLVVENTDMPFGMPMIFYLAHWALAKLGVQAAAARLDFAHLTLHPTAIAAWVGMFATSMNLLPGGQFDGGHISFGLNQRTHRAISFLVIVVLIPLAVWFSATWLIWAIFLRLTIRHPPLLEYSELGKTRILLTVLAVLMLVLTFAYNPLPETGLLDFLKQWKK
jgi:membrane-associated protease RseP (regulator of RpoE activity)